MSSTWRFCLHRHVNDSVRRRREKEQQHERRASREAGDDERERGRSRESRDRAREPRDRSSHHQEEDREESDRKRRRTGDEERPRHERPPRDERPPAGYGGREPRGAPMHPPPDRGGGAFGRAGDWRGAAGSGPPGAGQFVEQRPPPGRARAPPPPPPPPREASSSSAGYGRPPTEGVRRGRYAHERVEHREGAPPPPVSVGGGSARGGSEHSPMHDDYNEELEMPTSATRMQRELAMRSGRQQVPPPPPPPAAAGGARAMADPVFTVWMVEMIANIA